MDDRNPLVVLQDDLWRGLYATPYFVDVGVFKLRDATIQSRIDAVVQGLEPQNNKIGCAVSVMMAQMRVQHPNAPGPQPNVQLTIRCQEHPDFNFGLSNGAKKSAEELALQVMRNLNHRFADGYYSALFFEQDAGVPNYDYAPLVTYDVTALTTIPVDEWDQVATPSIDVNGAGQVVLECVTPGAQIWWTIDDTHPAPANGTRAANGTAYTGPIASGQSAYFLRAAAFDPAGVMRSSNVSRDLIPAFLGIEGGGFLRSEDGQPVGIDPL